MKPYTAICQVDDLTPLTVIAVLEGEQRVSGPCQLPGRRFVCTVKAADPLQAAEQVAAAARTLGGVPRQEPTPDVPASMVEFAGGKWTVIALVGMLPPHHMRLVAAIPGEHTVHGDWPWQMTSRVARIVKASSGDEAAELVIRQHEDAQADYEDAW